MNIYDVQAGELIPAVAAKLKEIKEIAAPTGAKFWKTGWFKEFPPEDAENFWFIRGASLMRKLYRNPIGVNHLRKQYGGRVTNVVHLAHSAQGSGAIIRRLLQQLEKAKLVQKTEKGRELTNLGRSLLDKTAAELLRSESATA
jgi:small subunit ribosomal protein S19e